MKKGLILTIGLAVLALGFFGCASPTEEAGAGSDQLSGAVRIVHGSNPDAADPVQDLVRESPVVGETLSVDVRDLNGVGNRNLLGYQWYQVGNAAIQGATRNAYTVTEEDRGKALLVRVTYPGYDGYVTSSQTPEVTGAGISGGDVGVITDDGKYEKRAKIPQGATYRYRAVTTEDRSGLVWTLTPNVDAAGAAVVSRLGTGIAPVTETDGSVNAVVTIAVDQPVGDKFILRGANSSGGVWQITLEVTKGVWIDGILKEGEILTAKVDSSIGLISNYKWSRYPLQGSPEPGTQIADGKGVIRYTLQLADVGGWIGVQVTTKYGTVLSERRGPVLNGEGKLIVKFNFNTPEDETINLTADGVVFYKPTISLYLGEIMTLSGTAGPGVTWQWVVDGNILPSASFSGTTAKVQAVDSTTTGALDTSAYDVSTTGNHSAGAIVTINGKPYSKQVIFTVGL